MRESCPMHMDEDLIEGTRIYESGGFSFTCPCTTGHAFDGPFSWEQTPPPPGLPDVSELASELRLDVNLPVIVSSFGGAWVEYGVIEERLAQIDADAFRFLVTRYGHTAIAPTKYTASAFLGATLGRLAERGEFVLRRETSSGRWRYNHKVSWCAIEPAQNWETRVSWESTGKSMDYVPGNSERVLSEEGPVEW